jgi:RND family efflux transporter MFP subunit
MGDSSGRCARGVSEIQLNDWLSRLGAEVGALGALLVLGKDPAGPFDVAAVWPREIAESRSELRRAAEVALGSGRPLVRARASGAGGAAAGKRRDGELPPAVLAVPFQIGAEPGGEGLRGVVGLELPGDGTASPESLVERVQRAVATLPVRLRDAGAGRASTSGGLDPAASSLALASVCGLLDAAHLGDGALAAATRIASALGARRVAIGVREDRRVRCLALSDIPRFDPRANAVRALEAALEEAVDQESPVALPPASDTGSAIAHAHAKLAEGQGQNGALRTLPLRAGGSVVGALHVAWREEAAHDGAAEGVAAVADALGPALEARRRAERPLGVHIRDLLHESLSQLLGPGHLRMKLALGVPTLLALLLALIPATYRVSSPARLEGSVQRAVVAPVDGYVSEAGARAGDLVRAGELLGRLDEADLRLEQRKWQARRDQLGKAYHAAIARRDRTEVSVLGAQVDQAEAELALVEAQLARTLLVAPFDGVVARGDLSRSLGSPVSRGEVLFEVAPLESFRVVVEVDERDVAHLDAGQAGALTLTALPGERLPFTVSRVSPLATAAEGRNAFPVEAELEAPPESLRPGMEGVARVEVGRRSLLWITTHRVVDWLRLAAWAWLP